MLTQLKAMDWYDLTQLSPPCTSPTAKDRRTLLGYLHWSDWQWLD